MDPRHLSQLAFVRYLYQTGVEQSRTSEPRRWASILTFEDAAELFLVTACDHVKGSPKKGAVLMDYWSAVDAKIHPETLDERLGITNLQRVRHSLKHQFTAPSEKSISDARTVMELFLTSNTKKLFNIEFNRIDLSFLVEKERVRWYLDKAGELVKAAAYNDALVEVLTAWRLLTEGTLSTLGKGIVDAGRHVRRHARGETDHGFIEFARSISEEIYNVRVETVLIGCGIDYIEGLRFAEITRNLHVNFTVGGQRLVNLRGSRAATEEEVEFCKNFVINAALKWQRAFPAVRV